MAAPYLLDRALSRGGGPAHQLAESEAIRGFGGRNVHVFAHESVTSLQRPRKVRKASRVIR
jgi:hypothetical protein